MPYIFLSYPMSAASPRPPAIPAPEIVDFMTIRNDGAGVKRVSFYNHTGTHLDTAAHVIEGGVSIENFAPEDLIFRDIAVISLDLPDKHRILPADLEPYGVRLSACDMAVFRFGVEEIRRGDPYRFSNLLPGFTREAAAWLRARCPRLHCLGTDLPSFAVISDLENTMAAHNVFLEGNDRKMLIIEEMKLDVLPPGIIEIIVSPWLFDGMDSGPCTVWGRGTENAEY